MRSLIGARIGDYDIEAEIGRGAMGVVYRAQQVSLNRPIALKVLPAHLAQDEAYIARFKREAQAAAALSHSNIVHVYTANTTEDLHYFVMEYVEGETLHERLAREGRIPPDEATAICVYLAQALDYAWKKAQIIHRDIKPSNVFLSKDGEVKLGDLGLAKSVGDMSAGQSVTKDGQTVGTAYFMSPEQARGDHDLDFRSDVYSLGCTLYQMISGRFPYEGTFGTVIAKQITEPPPVILKVAPDCPPPIVKLLAKMLAKHPTARHQSYEELIQDLWRAHDQITHPERSRRREEADKQASQSQPPPHVGGYKKPAVLYAAMTTTIIIALAGVLVWAPWKQSEQQPLNSEDGKARSAPVTQTILSAAAASLQGQPEPASEAPPLGSESRLQAEAVSPAPPPAKAGTPNAAAMSMTQPSENVGGTSASRPAARNGALQAPPSDAAVENRRSLESSRGAEATPTFQPPVAERASVQQSAPSPTAGTLARSATNATAIQVAQATPQPAPTAATPAAQPSAAQPADEAFIKSVSAMQPEQQVQAVIAKLKELNANFDGKETHKIENGAVTMLGFSTVGVSDISPVKALRWLRTLTITPPALNQKGSVENLAPLQGMQLTWLWCHNNPISDLSPLKGMPLTVLSFGGTQVSDLSPLAGMKLQVLSFNDTVVSDMAALEGMPLTVLWCNNTKVADLSSVKAMPLREIKCDFVAERDAVALRGIRTLAKINDLPAATFWMRVGPLVGTGTSAGNVEGASAPRPAKATPPPNRGTEAVATLAIGPEKSMTSSIGVELVWIPPGEFMMGSTEEERTWAVGAEGQVGITMLFEKGTPKRTQIKDGYWLGRTEVTVSQWKRFVEATNYVTEAEKKGFGAAYDTKTGKGSQVKDACWRNPHFGFELKNDHPVCCVTWDDAFAFCEWLTETEKNAGKLPPGLVYRLPGEAEWEYACRAGTATKFWWGDKMTGIERRVNGSGKNDGYAYVAPVNTYGARGRNRFGLADMLGNVWEWCLDGFDPEGPHQEPYLAATSSKVMRGGSFHDTPGWTRSAYRCRKPRNEPSVLYGFRICCGVPY